VGIKPDEGGVTRSFFILSVGEPGASLEDAPCGVPNEIGARSVAFRGGTFPFAFGEGGGGTDGGLGEEGGGCEGGAGLVRSGNTGGAHIGVPGLSSRLIIMGAVPIELNLSVRGFFDLGE